MVPDKEEERSALLLSAIVFGAGMTLFLGGCSLVVLIDYWGGDLLGLLLLMMGLWVMLVAFKKDVDEEELIGAARPSRTQPLPAGRYPSAGAPVQGGRAPGPYPADAAQGGPDGTRGPWRYPEPSSSRWESRRGTSWTFFHRDVKNLVGDHGFQLGILLMAAVLLIINAVILVGMMDFDTLTFKDGLSEFFPYMLMMDGLFPAACIVYCVAGYVKLHRFERTYG